MDSDEDSHRAVDKKKNPVHIREMRVEDLPGVFHLGDQLFTAEDFPNLHRTWDEYEVVNLFNNETEYCLVAELDGRVVGFALGTLIEKRRSSWTYGYLLWFGVSPDHQGDGLATRLFKQFRERMADDGARIMIVDTQADNFRALKFFRRQGFDQAQEHIYLSMNIDEFRRDREKHNNNHRPNGRSQPCEEN